MARETTDSLVGLASAGLGIGLALADVSVVTLGFDGYQACKKYQLCLEGH